MSSTNTKQLPWAYMLGAVQNWGLDSPWWLQGVTESAKLE